MFKLTYNGKTTTFKSLPSFDEVVDFTGTLLTRRNYDSLIKGDAVWCFSGKCTLVNKPTIEQLNSSWNDFLKIGIYQDQRFGQWFYNQFEYEVDNSYNIERPYQAYQVLYDNLVTTLDNVLGDEG